VSEQSSAWIITGLSGAGKATAAAGLAQAGIPVHDNLPLALLPGWLELDGPQPGIAVIDARQGEAISGFVSVPGTRVLFLDAADPVLLRRLAESTAAHPCASAGTQMAPIRRERELLSAMRAAADTVIDTSELTAAELQKRVRDVVGGDATTAAAMRVTVSSFGFKHGPQTEADWVIDVRFLRNPFWDPALRPGTGLDQAVREYVFADPLAAGFCERVESLLRLTLGGYASHRRRYLHVAFGCTGGRHRSVVLAEEMARRLRDEAVEVDVRHRDVKRSDPR
jgi:UPF0042 nucleotide-binding protein